MSSFQGITARTTNCPYFSKGGEMSKLNTKHLPAQGLNSSKDVAPIQTWST